MVLSNRIANGADISIYLTCASPQVAKTTLWILQPKGPAGNDRFVPFAV